MKRVILCILLAVTCVQLFAQKTFVADGITYRIVKSPDESATFGLVSVAPKEIDRYEGDIEIPNAVKESDDEYSDSYKVIGIDARAFAECENLTSLIIPASIESIGEMAFYLCGLESITIPLGNLTQIPDRAFYCSSLKSIVLPSSITSIGYQAFASGSLEKFKSKGGLQSIGKEAFAYSKLKSFTCASGLAFVGDYAFKDCVSLETIDIKGDIKVAGKDIFSGCTSLSSMSTQLTAQPKTTSALDGLNKCWETSTKTTIDVGGKSVDVVVMESYQFHYDLSDKSQTTGFFSSAVSIHYIYKGVEIDQGSIWRVGSWRQNGKGLTLTTTTPTMLFLGESFSEQSKLALTPGVEETTWEIKNIKVGTDSLSGTEDGQQLVFVTTASPTVRNLSTVTDPEKMMNIMMEFYK